LTPNRQLKKTAGFLVLADSVTMGDNAPVPLKRKQHQVWFSSRVIKKENSLTKTKKLTKFRGRSPKANYTDRATAACQRS
jgi:hypothetical protein